MIDLDANSLALIKKILKKHLPNTEVKAVGSRVTGRAKQFSDLDLVVMSDQVIAIEKMNALKFEFSNSDLPILIDVVDWNAISDEFREKIYSDCVTLIAK